MSNYFFRTNFSTSIMLGQKTQFHFKFDRHREIHQFTIPPSVYESTLYPTTLAKVISHF